MKNEKRCSGIDTHPSAQNEQRITSNGVVLYEGPSQLNHQPIIAIATGLTRPSRNAKTGPMIQTWILHRDTPPIEAARTGADTSICGDCKLRKNGDGKRACYVTLHHAPQRVWREYQRDAYPLIAELAEDWPRRHAVRFGSYGDPAAVPSKVWLKIAVHAASWTGYTHHWRRREFQHLRWLVMASVDTEAEAWEAHALGWRTYRIRLPEEDLLPFESTCPASSEAGFKTDCEHCGQCNGTQPVDVRRSYTIIAHGQGRGAYQRLRIIQDGEVRT